MQEYMALERRWVSVLNMPRAVKGAGAVALDGKLLVIGGIDTPGNYLPAVLEYDPADCSWKEPGHSARLLCGDCAGG